MAGKRKRIDLIVPALPKELDEVLCPICMEHPHNAVLALCGSHEKGCRSFICDTSYRHSNCLDRFKRQADSSRNDAPLQSAVVTDTFNADNHADTNLSLSTEHSNVNENNHLDETNGITLGISEGLEESSTQNPGRQPDMQGQGVSEAIGLEFLNERVLTEEADIGSASGSGLKCPLCRGDILGWEVVKEARKYFDMKKRSCSRESCTFSGNYKELRRHAKRVHPATKPADTDPSREQAWRSLELQREYGDIVSAIQSSTPGAFVVGDYAIENDNGSSVARGHGMDEVDVPWWTTFLFSRMINSTENAAELRPRSRIWTRQQRLSRGLTDRRFLWGENLLGLQDDEDEEDEDEDDVRILSDAGEDAALTRRRHRGLNRSRSGDQS